MTFPAHYPFAGNKSEQTKQIGNAVPPLMGKVLALELLKDYASSAREGGELIEMPMAEEVCA
jgi:site-specific DNA-cytosine methylase